MKRFFGVLLALLLLCGCAADLPRDKTARKIAVVSRSGNTGNGSSEVKTDNSGELRYSARFLNNVEKEFYRKVVSFLKSPQEGEILTSDILTTKTVIDYVLYDYPEFYFADFSFIDEKFNSFEFSYKEGLNAETVKARKDKMDTITSGVIAKAKTDYEKAIAIHDYLGETITYDYGFSIEDSDNAYGAIVRGAAYCDGFARGFQYMADFAGLENAYIKGRDLAGTTHAWNAVKIEGEWYYIDVTWDRKSVEYAGAYHDFCLMSKDEALKERVWDNTQYPSIPDSGSNESNFYVKEKYAIYLKDKPEAYIYLEDLADIFLRQLEKKDNLSERYYYTFLEAKIIGTPDQYDKWKSTFTKETFALLSIIEEKARQQGLGFSVSTNTTVSCYFNDSMQVLAFYPKAKVAK